MGMDPTSIEYQADNAAKYAYVLTGYWRGVKPGVAKMEYYESKMTYPKVSPGVCLHEPNQPLDIIITNGLGLVNPEKLFNFYGDLHSYLASSGINGVKVDVQNILETLGVGHGGRVKLARKYHKALEAAIARNFLGNDIISCMSHNTDGLYSAKRIAVIRAFDAIHISSVAYNTIFLREFMQLDWDIFQSLHPMAEHHAAARIVGSCAIYVSDNPRHHDFDLLRKLVLPDGSILRAKLHGRHTRDCFFRDPARDGKRELDGARLERGTLSMTTNPALLAFIRAIDVNYLDKLCDSTWNGDAILYSHLKGKVAYLRRGITLSISLNSKQYEVFTVVPVKKLSIGAAFAQVGLIKMFNAAGSIKHLSVNLRKLGQLNLESVAAVCLEHTPQLGLGRLSLTTRKLNLIMRALLGLSPSLWGLQRRSCISRASPLSSEEMGLKLIALSVLVA